MSISLRSIALCVLLGALALCGLWWRGGSSPEQSKEALEPIVTKQAVNFANRAFDPTNPPSDMPPLPPGELAECESNFMSEASVAGQSRQTSATSAVVTITQVKVNLQLNVTIWAPDGVAPHVIEHEEGHRQISEAYYRNADKLAERIAAAYMGRQVTITGSDLHAEFSKLLQQMGADITDQYSKELNPDPAQLRYDAITDHSRNEVVAQDAAAEVLRDTPLASADPVANPGN